MVSSTAWKSNTNSSSRIGTFYRYFSFCWLFSLSLACWATSSPLSDTAGGKNKSKRREDETYAKQIASLDSAKTALQSLTSYIDQQKRQLELSRSALESLKNEESKIRPLVEADQLVIDAIFAAQAERNQALQSRQKWVGIVVGVIGSLIASVISTGIALVVKRRRAKQTSQSPELKS